MNLTLSNLFISNDLRETSRLGESGQKVSSNHAFSPTGQG